MEKQAVYEIVLSEVERAELVKIIDAGVKSQGLNLNLGMVHHLCKKMGDAKPIQKNEEPVNQEKSVERFDDTQPKQGEPANDTQ